MNGSTSQFNSTEAAPDFARINRAAYFFTTSITKLMIDITSDSNSKSVISASFINDAEESGSNAPDIR